MTESLDPTDWAILVEVQRDGRIPLTELGRRVNLSASATTERVKRLESSGIISGYRADIDLTKVGFAVLAAVGSSIRAVSTSRCDGCSRSVTRSSNACERPGTTATPSRSPPGRWSTWNNWSTR
jgi:DNA-binding Lrp family transcriptional regulator